MMFTSFKSKHKTHIGKAVQFCLENSIEFSYQARYQEFQMIYDETILDKVHSFIKNINCKVWSNFPTSAYWFTPQFV